MKKFYVRDADGEEYEVEEVEEINECHDDETTEATETALTADEIAALKKLAEVADRLIATLETAEEDPIADEEPEEKTEEVIETKTNDSMRSFGAIERKKVVDEAIDNDVDDAWTKRYGGK